MRKFLVLTLFLTGIACHAQIKNFTVHLGAGIPVIRSVQSVENMNPMPIPAATGYSYVVLKGTMEQTFSNRSAFVLTGQFDYGLTSKFFLTSGLSLNYTQFKRSVRIQKIDRNFEGTLTVNPPAAQVGSPFGSITFRDVNGEIVPDQILPHSKDAGKTTTMSVQVPVLIGTSAFNEKLKLRLGPVFSYLLRATEVQPTYANGVFADSKVSSKKNFNEVNAGLSVQTTFFFSPRFGANFTGEKFFTPIYNSDQTSKAKYNLLMFGISYQFN